VLLVAHIVQMQTSFETIPTYFVWGLILGYGVWLERRQYTEAIPGREFLIMGNRAKVSAVLLIGVVLVGSSIFWFTERARQRAVLKVFQEANQVRRENHIKRGLEGSSSFESLRLTSTSFIKGVMENAATVLSTEEGIASVRRELDIYDALYDAYIETYPNDYRARMDYGYLLLFQSVLGNDQVEKAHSMIAPGYDLSPNHPLTYALDSMAFLYEGKIEESDTAIARGVALNPDIEFTQQVVEYLERQKKSLPRIQFIVLENL
jgi:hypothetical protein